MGRRFLTRMISLSPSQTSFHSSTGDGDSRAEGFWEVERCRQIRFNYQVSEQLQILPNPSRFLSPETAIDDKNWLPASLEVNSNPHRRRSPRQKDDLKEKEYHERVMLVKNVD